MHQAFTSPIEQNTVELINERIDTWTLTINTAVEYFTEVARCEQLTSRCHHKLASSLAHSVSGPASASGSSSPKSDPGGRSNFFLGPLQAFSLQTASGSDSLQQFIREETIQRLERLKEEFLGRSKDIKERLGKVQKHLGREQEGLLKAMRDHEKLWTGRLEKTFVQSQLSESPSGGSAGAGAVVASEQKDVWLSELQLHGQIESFLGEKDRFCRILHDLYTEVRLLNADCARRVEQVIVEHFTVKSKQGIAQIELMKDVCRGIEAVEPEKEWQASLVRARLDYEWRLEAPPIDGFTQSVLHQISNTILTAVSVGPSATSIPSSPLARAPSSSIAVRPVRVLKSGYLMRPGSTFGPSWQVLFFVLTDSHYLHAYVPETKKRARKHSISSSGTPDPVYTVPSPDDQLNQRQLHDSNLAISTAWLGFLKPNAPADEWLRIDLRLLEPALTIPLFEGVQVAVDSPNAHEWTVMVPGAGSFFGRSDKKHHFRSFVEEDMVDWCIALKDQVSASIDEPKLMVAPASQSSATALEPARPSWTEEPAYEQVERPHDDEDDGDYFRSSFSTSMNLTDRSAPTATASTTSFTMENPWG